MTRKSGFLSVVFLGCALFSRADAELATGAVGSLPLLDISSYEIEPWARAEGDLVVPLSDSASILMDATGRAGYELPGQLPDLYAAAGAALSWNQGPVFWKIGARSEAESDPDNLPAWVEVSSDVEVSVDFSRFTLAFAPAAYWRASDTQEYGFEGGLLATMSAGEETILRAKAGAGLSPADAQQASWFVEGGGGLTWYSDAPFVLSVDAACVRNVSPASETVTVDGVLITVPAADGSSKASLAAELSASLGPSVLLTVSMPGWFSLADHGAVVSGVLVADPEWVLGFAPTAALQVDLSRSFALKASIGADLAWSNSAYQEKRTVLFALEATLSFEQGD